MFLKSAKVARLERELAVSNELRAMFEQQLADLRADHLVLARRYDRLVEARLFKQGDISAPIGDAPARNTRGPLATVFGAIGRMDKPDDSASGLPMST